MRDRRFEPRYGTNEPVELSWSGDAVGGVLRDFSRSGARIDVDRPIPVGTTAQMTIRGEQLRVEVRSCEQSPSGYTAGVEFEPDSQGKLKRPR